MATMLTIQLAPPSPASAADEATLTNDVTPEDPAYNGNLAVSSVEAFDPEGGTAVFEPGTASEETFTYTSTDSESVILTGVRREAPSAHPAGSPVGPVDAEAAETAAPGTPVPSESPTADDAAPTTEPSASDAGDAGGDGSSSANAGDSSQASSAGVIPGPCDISEVLCAVAPPIECQGCDTVLATVLEMVGPCLETSEGCADPVVEIVNREIQEHLNGLCQTRMALPECARQLIALIESSYASLVDDIYPDTSSMIDAQFCTDPENCDAVMGAVAEVLYREIREECALEDIACLQLYATDINESISAVALITCSSQGCADYVATRIQVGLAENIRIFRTLVFEILEGLPTDPGQLEVALARDSEIPDALVEPLVDLLVPGPGSASADETPGGAGEGSGGEVAGGAVTGGGGKRRCVFKGTSYNKGSMDYEGSTNPDDPATTGSGGFSYTDDDLGAHSSNESYVRSPFSTGQTEYHKDAQVTGVKFKYMKGKYGGDWVTAQLSYPWHVEGELSVNNTWTNIPIGGVFSAEGIADYSVWVGYVDLTEGGHWNFAQVSGDRLERDGHRYISDDPVAPPSLTLQLKPGHTYAAWIEIFTSASAHAMFSTRSEVKSYFATHFPTGHPPNNERHDRSWLDKIVLETERRVRCGAGSA